MNTTIWLLILTSFWTRDYSKEIKLTHKIATEGIPKTVVVDNLFGKIQVNRAVTDFISYEVTKTIHATSASDLETGLSEINLGIIERNDSIILFMKAPYICDQWSGCKQNGRWIRRDKDDYDFVFDFELKVPFHTNLSVQTIDEGDVQVTGIAGVIEASNVNGHVTIHDAQHIDKASTVNGNVEVQFAKKPQTDGNYETVNGDIRLHLPPDMNGLIAAKTMHGNLYTDFDYQTISPKLQTTRSKSGNTTHYQLDNTFSIKIGQNGPRISFETLNGDIYLKKQ